MKLDIEVKFNCPTFAGSMGLIGYKSNVVAESESFEINDFEKQSYALKILNEEFESAVKRVNEQLLASGFGKESFRKSLLMKDEKGHIVDVNVY